MHKANVSASITRYEDCIKPLDEFFKTYSGELKPARSAMKNNLAHFQVLESIDLAVPQVNLF